MKINRNKDTKNLKGFTLVELIVVIAIIGILASILVPNMMGYIQKANVKRAVADAKTVQNVLSAEVTSYYVNNNTSQKNDLEKVKNLSTSGGYRINDPENIFDFEIAWGSSYSGIIYDFEYTSEGFEFRYTTKNLENVYMVYYNKPVDSSYEEVEKGVFTVAKKK